MKVLCLLLFTLCCHYGSALTQQEMFQNTKFRTVSCDINRGAYVYTVVNGFVVNLDASVILDCDGSSPVEQTFTVNPGSNSTQRVIGLPGLSVQNRVCTLIYRGENPLNVSDILTFQVIPTTCGQVFGDQSVQCDYPEFWCMFDTGDWYHNSFAWLIIDAATILVFSIFIIVYALYNYIQNRQKFADQVSYSSNAKSEDLDRVYGALPSLDESGKIPTRRGMEDMPLLDIKESIGRGMTGGAQFGEEHEVGESRMDDWEQGNSAIDYLPKQGTEYSQSVDAGISYTFEQVDPVSAEEEASTGDSVLNYVASNDKLKGADILNYSVRQRGQSRFQTK